MGKPMVRRRFVLGGYFKIRIITYANALPAIDFAVIGSGTRFSIRYAALRTKQAPNLFHYAGR